ncbi:MAG: hypothetical protein JF614_03760 [Acidobacteria bacterium]|nr:hypothetical protein [Acidobacteriota bacterium]
MKTKIDSTKPKTTSTSRKGQSQQVVRDAAWKAEKKWFEENMSLDPLALFAKYYQRLG